MMEGKMLVSRYSYQLLAEGYLRPPRLILHLAEGPLDDVQGQRV
jgi:hypothetical protein